MFFLFPVVVQEQNTLAFRDSTDLWAGPPCKIGLECSNLQLRPLFLWLLGKPLEILRGQGYKGAQNQVIEAYSTNISNIWSWSKGIHLVAWQTFFKFVDVTSEPPRTSIWTSHLPSGVVAWVRHATVHGWNPAPPGMFKTLVNTGISYLPQLVSRISSINRISPSSKSS